MIHSNLIKEPANICNRLPAAFIASPHGNDHLALFASHFSACTEPTSRRKEKKKWTSHVVLERQVPIVVLPSCWALGRTSASRAPCSQRMTHPGRPRQQSFGSSGLCLASWETEGKKKVTAYGFESSSLLNYSSFTHSEGAASPPYTSSMHTIPSPDFSMWVMVTVAARPDATARPAGGQPGSERETLQTHCQTHFSTAPPSPTLSTLTVLCSVQSSNGFLQTVPRRVSAAAVFKSLEND